MPASGDGHLSSVNDVAIGEARAWRSVPGRLWLRHTAEAAQLPLIRRRVRRWAEQNAVPDDTVIDLQLALGEAVSNGVDHAYHEGEPGTVDVELEIRPTGGVLVRVVDHGRWRPPPFLKGYRGRGLALIEQLSEGMRVTTSGYGTQISFVIP